LLRKFLLLLFVGSACLIAGEFVVRRVAPQDLVRPNRHIWRPDDEIGWRHVEGTDTRINTGERTVRFRTDTNGYRIGEDEEPEEDLADVQVLLLGDSFVEATAVPWEQSFAGVLERLLERRTGLSVRVVCDGVGGWDPNQYLRETQIALEKKRYDLGIVFLYLGNDLVSQRQDTWSPDVVSARHPLRWPRSLSFREMEDALIYPIDDLLKTRSQLWMLAKRASRYASRRLGLTDDMVPEEYQIAKRDSLPAWEVTSEIFFDIEDRFARAGTPVLFVLLPQSFQVYREVWEDWIRSAGVPIDSVDLELPNHALADAFESRGMVLDDALDFLRVKAREAEPLYGKVDRHFSPTGHEAMAEFLLETIIESGILENGLDRSDTDRAALTESPDSGRGSAAPPGPEPRPLAPAR
jgi:hypothetical protein